MRHLVSEQAFSIQVQSYKRAMDKKKTIEGEEPEASKQPCTRGNKDPNSIGKAHSHDSNEQNATTVSNEEREESLQAEPLDEKEHFEARSQESSQMGGNQDIDLVFRSKMLEFMDFVKQALKRVKEDRDMQERLIEHLLMQGS